MKKRVGKYYFAIIIVLLGLLSFFVQEDLERYASLSWDDVINSYRVEPRKPVFSFGEQIRFRSFRDLGQDASLNFYDTIICRLDSEEAFETYDQGVYLKRLTEKTNGENIKGWRFDGYCTKRPATCYLETQVCLDKVGVFKDSCMPRFYSPVFRCE